MDNQERNREALIEHIDELQRIILQCNQQIENQARNAEEDQRAIEEIGAERDEYRAMHSEQMKTIARLQENPRTLTANDIDGDSVIRAQRAAREHSAYLSIATVHDMLTAALTPPPSRPEGAVGLQVLIDECLNTPGSGKLADYLAARLIDPTVKEQS